MIRNYLKTALRRISRDKGLAFIKVLGLSIGITCCLVIYTFVSYELSFDQHHEKADQIYRVVQHTKYTDDTYYWSSTAYPLAEALRNDFPNDLSLVTQTAGPVTRNFGLADSDSELDKFDEEQVLFVDPYFWQVFDVNWLQGNSETAFSNMNSAVLTKSLAVQVFGKSSVEANKVIGKILQLNHKDALQITGVVDDPPVTSSIRFRMLVPYEFFRVNNPYFAENWSGNYQGTTYIIPQADTPVSELERQIDTWKSKYLDEQDRQRISYALQPLPEIHTETLYSTSINSYTMPMKVTRSASWIGIFILLIACINFINLAMAQASRQAKEVGVRKVLGGSRVQLFTQHLSENSLIVGGAIVISLLLTTFCLRQINDLLAVFRLELSLSSNIIGISLLLALIVSALATVYPALVVSAFEPVKALKGNIVSFRDRSFGLHKSLIVLQFSIVLVLGTCALVVYQQLKYVQDIDLGFTTEAIVTTKVPSEQQTEALRTRLLNQPAITEVTLATGAPTATGIRNGTTARLPHQTEVDGIESEMKSIDLHYLDFYQLELIAGRNFTRTSTQFDEFIVNETLANALFTSPEAALGQELDINEGRATIVGVVRDYHNNSLQEEISPGVFINWDYGIYEAAVRLSGLSDGLAQLKEGWEAVFPQRVYEYAFLDDQLASSYQLEQMILRGFTIFAILAILIACLGLIGLTTFSLTRRTKEIGIRKVLGATVQQVFALLSQQYLKLIIIAAVIAVPVANYFLADWLADFAYRITIAWWFFVLPTAMVLLIALIAISTQTLQAATRNPMDSLRNE
ncbi:ABC transporter permease [Tunicatimonas pelagia]|uniref:ABC transporter permease n=1 Tax=Tunicatimonas pelagia TaxID=931531 RepID=UPI002666B7E4|nr:ABC transporter permease [Tunicatimonas pelagia]WKN43461.1 ABC transporter permease [Tunicatimonas pelagia]